MRKSAKKSNGMEVKRGELLAAQLNHRHNGMVKVVTGMRRETESLRRIGDGFRKIVIVNDPIPRNQQEDGILMINALDFLSDGKSIFED